MVSKIKPSNNFRKRGVNPKVQTSFPTVVVDHVNTEPRIIRSDVIDLGGPPGAPYVGPQGRHRRRYIPNPRLYPGPKAKAKSKKQTKAKKEVVNKRDTTSKKRVKPESEPRPRRHKRTGRCSVPNARLYLAPPARRRPPPRPPAVPPVTWSPPPPPLHTASSAALQLAERRTLDSLTTIDPRDPAPPEPISYVAAQAWPLTGPFGVKNASLDHSQSSRPQVTLPGSSVQCSCESVRSLPPPSRRQPPPLSTRRSSARSNRSTRRPPSSRLRPSARRQCWRTSKSARSRLSNYSRRVAQTPLRARHPVTEKSRQTPTIKRRFRTTNAQPSSTAVNSSGSRGAPTRCEESYTSHQLRGAIVPTQSTSDYRCVGAFRRPQKFTTLPGAEPRRRRLKSPEYWALSPPPLRYRPRSIHFKQRSLEPDSDESADPAARPPKPQVQGSQPASRSTSSAQSAVHSQVFSTVPSPVFSVSMAQTPRWRPASRSDGAEGTDGSDGNDSHSAPSELLAEFLSAIMRRQYPEALKYCRQILHYEPNNSTARGFYPLLQHKVETAKLGNGAETAKDTATVLRSSSSDEYSSPLGEAQDVSPDDHNDQDPDDQDESDSNSCASLSLDSSHSSRSLSPASPELRLPRTLSDSRASGGSLSGSTGSGPHSSASACPASADGSPPSATADDNGNPLCYNHHDDDDLENDNAAGGDHTPLLKDTSLQQLRAQFACSIK